MAGTWHFARTTCLLVLPLVVPDTHSRLAAQTPAGYDAAWRDASALYRQRVEDAGIIGSSLWFADRGRILGKELYGLADVETQRPVSDATIYHWASITKTFTGIAIMQLRDRDLVHLDDPIVHYLPELRAVHNPFGGMDEITIRHLMSHSSGFRGPTWPWGGEEPWHPHEPTAWSQIVAMLPYTRIHFEPGSRYGYSNPAIIFLGRIIEQITGDDYEVYVDKNILKPLGMYRAYFDGTPYHLLGDRSNNYYVTDGQVSANGLDFDTGITVSNGGLNAPIPDMIHYLTFLAGDASYPGADRYGHILATRSLEEMWQIQVEMPAEGESALREAMGLTFFVLRHRDLRVIGHTGGQKGFVSFFYVDPESGAAAIAAFNTLGIASDGDPRPDTRRVLRAVRDRLFENVFPLFRQNR